MISKFLSFWLVVESPSRCISGCLGYFCWTAHRVRSGELLNGSWELLGLILVGLGGDLGVSWVILRPSWGRPGLCWGLLGTAAAFCDSDPERGPGEAPGEIPGESWEGSRGKGKTKGIHLNASAQGGLGWRISCPGRDTAGEIWK